jgi:ATP-binding cassette subfamily B protein
MKNKKKDCKAVMCYDDAELALQKIIKAKSFFLNRTACLEQSLALFLLASFQGQSVDWCVGTRLAPFASHAWIEVNGVPVQEEQSIELYKKILVV